MQAMRMQNAKKSAFAAQKAFKPKLSVFSVIVAKPHAPHTKPIIVKYAHPSFVIQPGGVPHKTVVFVVIVAP